MSDRRPELYVINPDLEPVGSMGESKIYLPASPADLLAVVRRGVESGEIEGKVTTVEHDYYDHHANDGNLVKAGIYLVIPIGGSE